MELDSIVKNWSRNAGALVQAASLRGGTKAAALLPAPVAERYDTLRRDLRTVYRDLVGDRPAPFTRRAPLARHLLGGAASAPQSAATALFAPRRLRVSRVVRETKDAVSLFLADPSGAPITFVPGQFFTVLVRLPGGEVLRRAYSICTAPGEDGAAAELAITVKRVRGGRVSNHLNDHAREGDLVEVLGPSGHFTVPPGAGGPRHLVLFAGGSGITPLLSITRATLLREPGTRVSLVYGNRGEADIIFRDALAELAALHPERFTLRHVLEAPGEGFSGRVGLLDREAALAELDALTLAEGGRDIEYFLCGPEPMMAAAREALLARGAPPARVHEERFSAPERRAASAVPAAPERVHIRLGGAVRTVVAAPGQTLLEAALAAELPMPFSCAMGGCGACKVKLGAGRVTSEEPNCLTTSEREQGYVLACVSRAAAETTVEVP